MKGAVYVLRACLPIGIVIFLINRFVNFSEFINGFFTGMSSVFMIIGLIYVIVYLARGKNPYGSLKNKEEQNK